MPLSREDVLRVVQQHGPIIPNEIRKRVGASDSTLIGVYLSELTGDGTVKRTYVKLGSSRFYYTSEQRAKIAELTQHLDEKERRVAARLKEEGVMRAGTQDPLTRVALGQMRDFAIPLQVKVGEAEEVFYRWFLLDSHEAQERIRAILRPQRQEVATPEQPEEEAPKEEAKHVSEPETEQIAEQEAPAKEPVAPAKEKLKKPEESQRSLAEIEPESDFAQRLLTYFQEKHMAVKELEEVRKDSDVECVVTMPTPVGEITYFCKARNKKSSNDGDLAAAILAAKRRMLPALYLTTGKVTNKALEAPELQEITVVQLWE